MHRPVSSTMLLRFLLLGLSALLLVFAPAPATAIPPNASIESIDRTIFPINTTTDLRVTVRNRGYSTFFWIVPSSVPSGWSIPETDKVFIQLNRSATFTLRVSTAGPRNGSLTLQLWGEEDFNPNLPVVVTSSIFDVQSIEAPGPFSLIVPTAGSGSLTGDVQFEWEASERAATYTLSIVADTNGAPGTPEILRFENLTNSLTMVNLSGLTQGRRYWWTAFAVNGVGTVASRSGYWDFTSPEPPPPGDFTLTTPASGAQVSATPSFAWTASAGATGYRLNLFRDVNGSPAPSAFQTFTNLTGTSFTPTGLVLEPARYYATVIATNGFAEVINTNRFVPFSVRGLGPFSLSNPVGTLAIQPLRPRFIWTPSFNALGYRVRIYPSGNSTPLQEIFSETTEVTPATPLIGGARYDWDVLALAGLETRVSSIRASFVTTNLTPSNLIYPQPNAAGIPVRPAFKWTFPNGTVWMQRVQVAPESSTGGPDLALLLESPSLTNKDTWTPTADLSAGTRHFWRVLSQDGVESLPNFLDWQPFRTAETAREAETLELLLGRRDDLPEPEPGLPVDASTLVRQAPAAGS